MVVLLLLPSRLLLLLPAGPRLLPSSVGWDGVTLSAPEPTSGSVLPRELLGLSCTRASNRGSASNAGSAVAEGEVYGPPPALEGLVLSSQLLPVLLPLVLMMVVVVVVLLLLLLVVVVTVLAGVVLLLGGVIKPAKQSENRNGFISDAIARRFRPGRKHVCSSNLKPFTLQLKRASPKRLAIKGLSILKSGHIPGKQQQH